MTIIHALILGVVEGITEFLPISSTAHLEIVSYLFGLAQTDFVKSFEISIQLGAILGVIALYAKTLITKRHLWKPIVVAFIPTGIIGFLLYKVIKAVLLGNNWLIVATLFLGGIILIWFERWFEQKTIPSTITGEDSVAEISQMKTSTALWIGFAQALAIVPGVSRSAATIIAGRLLGLSRVAIIEFSFLLAIPTMAAATGYDIFKNASAFETSQFGLLAIGFVIAFITAIFAVRFLLNYIKNHSFAVFGVYRIIIALVFTLILLV